jgi:hypothetical protein
LWDSVIDGRKDGGLVRLLTPIGANETAEMADARMIDMVRQTQTVLPNYIPH